MGAGASVGSVYTDALDWFKKYFDTTTYKQDFKDIDKDEDGGITDGELIRWIKHKKQQDGGAWGHMVENKDLFRLAHEQTVKGSATVVLSAKGSRTFSMAEFRTFLIHLYAISILWTHFKHADDDERGHDVGNLMLNRTEFELAVETLTTARLREEVSSDQLDKDFELLDINKDQKIVFSEVCGYCCKYIASESSMLGDMPYADLNDVESKHFTRLNSVHTDVTVDPTTAAVTAIKDEVSLEKTKITFSDIQKDTESHLRSSFSQSADASAVAAAAVASRSAPATTVCTAPHNPTANTATSVAAAAAAAAAPVEAPDDIMGVSAVSAASSDDITATADVNASNLPPAQPSPRVIPAVASPRLQSTNNISISSRPADIDYEESTRYPAAAIPAPADKTKNTADGTAAEPSHEAAAP